VAAIALAWMALMPGVANAGPPFRTDDPEPVDYQHYEFYTFSPAPISAAIRQE